MAYGHSPFEVEGSSVVLAVQNGQYRFPQNDKVYTQGLRDLIAFMLVVDKSKRPNIHQVSGCLPLPLIHVTELIENHYALLSGHRAHPASVESCPVMRLAICYC